MIKVFSLLLSPSATNGSHHCQQHLSELTDLRAISVEEQVLQCIHNPVTYPPAFSRFWKVCFGNCFRHDPCSIWGGGKRPFHKMSIVTTSEIECEHLDSQPCVESILCSVYSLLLSCSLKTSLNFFCFEERGWHVRYNDITPVEKTEIFDNCSFDVQNVLR